MVHPFCGATFATSFKPGIARLKLFLEQVVRELSIFIDESDDFGPHEKPSPFYIVGLVFHDQSDSISGHLDGIHDGLVA
ncbi:MAG: hypothetical protein QM286_08730 [Acidobacteriota bacterium]|nr:hypothetical protein [Acidobacteriota bacterium]